MRIGEEPFSRWCREAIETGLFEAHWREVATHRDKITLEPDFEKLAQLERMQALVSFTVRDDAGKLAGYAMFLVTTHLHYKSHVFAYADIIYLAPEHRRGRTGIELIKVAERTLAARGVAKVVYHLTLSIDWGRVLERLGYAAAEKLFEKVLI